MTDNIAALRQRLKASKEAHDTKTAAQSKALRALNVEKDRKRPNKSTIALRNKQLRDACMEVRNAEDANIDAGKKLHTAAVAESINQDVPKVLL